MKYLTTLTGPSCAGKSTLEQMMAERGCLKVISTTTRAPRAGEVYGVDYYFVTHERFASMKDCGMFIEAVKFGKQSYGATATELHRLFMRGNHVVLVCEPNGAAQIRTYCAQQSNITLRQVFINNPMSVIADRFLRRVFQDATNAARTMKEPAVNALIHTHANRLAIMTSAEKRWVTDAYGPYNPKNATPLNTFHYDILVDKFDEVNSRKIADGLLRVEPVLV